MFTLVKNTLKNFNSLLKFYIIKNKHLEEKIKKLQENNKKNNTY